MSAAAGDRRAPGAEGFFRTTVEVTPLRLVMLFVLAAGFGALDLRAGIGPHDEGAMLQWGHRIGAGAWPYRDFWMNELPGQPLVQAVLGDSLVAWRVLRALTGGAAALLAYLLVRRETVNDRWALATWAAVAGAMAWPLTAGPNASAVALSFGALLAARRHPRWAGALAGLAFLFRPEVGVAAAIGVAVLARGWHRSRGEADPAVLRRATAGPLVVAAGVAVAGLLPFLVVSPVDLVSQTFGFPVHQRLQRLPFPLAPHTTDPNGLLERLFPAILVAGTGVWAAATLPRRRGGALVALMVVSLGYLLARTDELHLVPLSAVLAVAAAAAGARAQSLALKVTFASLLALIVLHGADRQFGKLRDATDMVAVDLPGAHGVRTLPADAQALEALADAVERRSHRGDPLLVAPPRFDRVRVGDPLLYTLLDRRNPTRYDAAQPGVVTTAEVQREMRADLIRSDTRLVVRWLAPAARKVEDNGSGRSSGVTLLDRYIATTFRPVGRFGDYLLLERR